ncbi:nuclear factor interleukin-3-regulated protein-like [Hypanus sabinus]|uniref:nuclear factor interleukin-3-regulated protein-like n=1 Tax=Hypanus sabinus TaxID=79690 RepID=UPI0028C3E309|nr:nuclear factor interleukin-3-regulated protein-like [Hypanus sabinus]XP_059846974.1 nuclear factor interleukin-3-regulated protein-like [Hypanus sabinus]XP_059846975.1 nuclear factor interleukin-3-regulated protein-like [Hypanus sabinus]XP_059846976.1 nuclear factor interleukin-3-regulated protein-like [Hypanus sabinus]
MLSALDLMVDLEPPGLKRGNFRGRLSSRRKREFMPEEKKDASYWEKRRKNNEAAKRSREKRRLNDLVLENKMLALSEENACLRAELLSLKVRYGLISSSAYSQETQLLHTYMQKYLARQRSIEMDPRFLEVDAPYSRDGFCSTRYPSGRFSHDSIHTSPQHTQDSVFHKIYTSPASVGVQTQYPSETSAEEPTMHNLPLNQLFSRYPCSLNETYPCFKPSSVFTNAVEVNVKSKREIEDDVEDEQEVPKMHHVSPFKDCRFECSTTVKTNCAALPHKLRIKAKPILAKEEKDGPEFDLEVPWKEQSPLKNTRSISLTEIKNIDVSLCGGICDCKVAFKPVPLLPICHSV